MHSSALIDKPAASIFGLALLLLCGAVQAPALDPERDPFQFNQQTWLAENGLPQNTVHSVTQGKDGYIWIATEEGLARFDGIRFAVFDKQNTPQLQSNNVRVLLEDRRGDLWIGTGDGLVQMRDGKFTTYTTEQGLPANVIDSLYQDHHDVLWIATSAGMVSFNNGVFTASQPDVPKDRIQAMFEDREGALWIGSPAGLARTKDGTVTRFTKQDGLANDNPTPRATGWRTIGLFHWPWTLRTACGLALAAV
jgi:ligand-binding sensor domain-containing protein